MNLQEQLVAWDNLRLAYQNAARGKRGLPAAAGFELHLADNLLEFEQKLNCRVRSLLNAPLCASLYKISV